MTWKREDPQGNEAAKISWEIVKWTRGRGLDIGAGMHRTFGHFITVDNNADARIFGHPMPRPDLWCESAEKLGFLADDGFDFVFSSHMLEHQEPKLLVQTLREWFRVLHTGGYLVLYLPDEDQYPKVGAEGANPDHKWNVSYDEVVRLMSYLGAWDLVDFQKRAEGQEYSLLFVFEKKALSNERSDLHREVWKDYVRPAKTVGVVRYGAYGDLIQAASVLAAFKAEGYHVTLYTSNPGYEVIKTDPHIDAFYLQDTDQVPNAALSSFWAYHAKKYDRWVNLSESVEGALLSSDKYPAHYYPPAIRHELLDRNYLEYQHQVAGVPAHPPRMKFYPTADEVEWARGERAKYGSLLVVWSLSGSSVHKHWPWLDQAVSGLLLDFPEVEVLFVGGPDGVVLEQGWENVARVTCRSGKWDIRKTLSFVQQADVVIGSETGVMNAVAQEEMPKVLFLSHSTVENLCRDWTNTHALASESTTCQGRGKNEAPACHQMHYGWDRCTEAPATPGTEHLHGRKGAGVAQCQYDIDAQGAYKVMWHVIQWRLEEYARRAGKPAPGVVRIGDEKAARLIASFPEHLRKHLAPPAPALEPVQLPEAVSQ